MADNPFDQFDQSNPFDQFDAPAQAKPRVSFMDLFKAPPADADMNNPLKVMRGTGEAMLALGSGVGAGLLNEGGAFVQSLLANNNQADPSKDYPFHVPSYEPRYPEGRAMVGAVGSALAPVAGLIEKGTDINNPDPKVRATGHLMNVASAFLPGKAFKVEREAAPSVADLRLAAKTGYKAGETTGEIASQSSLGKFANDVQTMLANEGFRSDLNPKTASAFNAVMEEATRPGVAGQSMLGLVRLRQVLRNAEDSALDQFGRPTADSRLAGQMLDDFDDYIDREAPRAGSAFADAAANWRNMRNAETIESAINRAQLNAESTTLENALRLQFKQLAANPKRLSRFNQEGQDAIVAAAKGDVTQKVLRQLAKLDPTSKFFPMVLEGGLLAHGNLPAAAVAAGTGIAASRLAQSRRIGMAQNALSTAALGRAPYNRLAVRPLPAGATIAPLATSTTDDEDTRNYLAR